jgi:hypothetical protein
MQKIQSRKFWKSWRDLHFYLIKRAHQFKSNKELQSLFDCEINSWQSFPGHITAPNQVISNPTDDTFLREILLLFIIIEAILNKVKCFNL